MTKTKDDGTDTRKALNRAFRAEKAAKKKAAKKLANKSKHDKLLEEHQRIKESKQKNKFEIQKKLSKQERRNKKEEKKAKKRKKEDKKETKMKKKKKEDKKPKAIKKRQQRKQMGPGENFNFSQYGRIPTFAINRNQRRTSTSSSGSNNNKRKRPRFQLKLPSNTDWSYPDVPWFPSLKMNPHIMAAGLEDDTLRQLMRNDCDDRDEDSSVNNNDNRKDMASSPKTLPILSQFSATALQELSCELNDFAKYVSLTNMELETRHSLIQILTDVAGTCYPSIDQNNIQFQCFGSFATPSICAFGSDVDLALFGVVPPERKRQEAACTIAAWHQGQREMAEKKKQQSSSKVQKWRNVLNKFYEREEEELLVDMQIMQNGNQQQEEETAKKTEKNQMKKGKELQFELADEKSAMELGATNTNDETPSLFVIDRAGDCTDDNGATVKEFMHNRSNSNSSVRKEIIDKENDNDDKEKDSNKEDKSAAPLKSSPFKILSQWQTRKQEVRNDSNSPIRKVSSEDEKDGNKEEQEGAAASVTSKSSSDDSADKLENLSIRNNSDSPIRNVNSEDEKDDNNEEQEGAAAYCSSSDEDPTDPFNFPPFVEHDGDSSCDDDQIIPQQRKRRRLNEDNVTQNDDFEVSFHSNQHDQQQQSSSSLLSEQTRRKVIKALGTLYTNLRKKHSHIVSQMELRRRAKVPIVYLETKYGFEVDIAIGGHQGMDTSRLPESLVNQYQSFAPVVLFLKVLLMQQDLDKPFTGGLGSYKLYVLVAHHLERYLEIGGNDEPGEVLMSFLRRFGGSRDRYALKHNSTAHSNSQLHYTPLTANHDTPISCRFPPKSKHECYEADLQPCHLLDELVRLFETGWNRLSQQLMTRSRNKEEKSFLVELIRPASLQQKRKQMYDSAVGFQQKKKSELKKQQHQEILQRERTKLFIQQRQLKKRTAATKASNVIKCLVEKINEKPENNGTKNNPIIIEPRDPDAADIMKGYSVQGLDTNGNLIPAAPPPRTTTTTKKRRQKSSPARIRTKIFN